MKILPDTGANVTAIDISQAKGIALEKTSIVLRVANRTVLDKLGTAECMISRHGNGAPELVYVVKGLAEPLLSKRMPKALNMLHPDWPHQNCSRAATNNVSSNGNEHQEHHAQNKPESECHQSESNERHQPESMHYNELQPEQAKLPPIASGNPQCDNIANEFRDTVFSEKCHAMKGDP